MAKKTQKQIEEEKRRQRNSIQSSINGQKQYLNRVQSQLSSTNSEIRSLESLLQAISRFHSDLTGINDERGRRVQSHFPGTGNLRFCQDYSETMHRELGGEQYRRCVAGLNNAYETVSQKLNEFYNLRSSLENQAASARQNINNLNYRLRQIR